MLGVGLDHQIVQADLVAADPRQLRHLPGVFRQQQRLGPQGAGQAVGGAVGHQPFHVGQRLVKIPRPPLGPVDGRVALRRPGVDRHLDPGEVRQGPVDEPLRQYRGVGGEGRVDTGGAGHGDDFGHFAVQKRLPLPGIHDAFDPEPPHLRQPQRQHFFIQAGGLVAHIIDGAKHTTVVADPDRGDLQIDRIDLLRPVPVVAHRQQVGGAPGVVDQLVAVDAEPVVHRRTRGAGAVTSAAW